MGEGGCHSPHSQGALQREAQQFAGIFGKHVSHLSPMPGVQEVRVRTVLKTTVGKQETAHQPLDLCREIERLSPCYQVLSLQSKVWWTLE